MYILLSITVTLTTGNFVSTLSEPNHIFNIHRKMIKYILDIGVVKYIFFLYSYFDWKGYKQNWDY